MAEIVFAPHGSTAKSLSRDGEFHKLAIWRKLKVERLPELDYMAERFGVGIIPDDTAGARVMRNLGWMDVRIAEDRKCACCGKFEWAFLYDSRLLAYRDETWCVGCRDVDLLARAAAQKEAEQQEQLRQLVRKRVALVRRRDSLIKQLKEVRNQLKAEKALAGYTRPPDGQRIRLYRRWGSDEARDEIGTYLEGVFYEKDSKRPYHTESKYFEGRYKGAHILCDNGLIVKFRMVKTRKDGNAGWRAV